MPLVSAIMNDARAMLNDVVMDIFTDAVLLPFVKMAYQDLQDEMTANGLQVTKEGDYAANVAIGAFTVATPADFIFPITVYEKGETEPATSYTELIERKWEPNRPTNLTRFTYWQFQENEIQFPGANNIRNVRVKYAKHLAAIVDGTTNVVIYNSQRYLSSRTAAMAAFCVGGNAERSEVYQADADRRLKTVVATLVRNDQNNPTRRQPFRKSR
jgi:hypothetical protein